MRWSVTICSRGTSVLSDDSVVWMIGDSAVTVIASSRLPGSSTIVRLRSVPTLSRFFGRFTDLKPESEARTAYGPTGRLGKTNSPDSVVTVS